MQALRLALAGDHLAHSLLLTGPTGIGKTHLALELAKALNCVGDDRPDQRCVHCLQIEHGSHPDVTMIERPEGKDAIRIEQVRELRDSASMRPFQGRTRVYILSGAEALTLQAADALLKTLEEPQPQVALILTATDAGALPATVVSRCRVLPLQPPGRDSVVRALVEAGREREAAERVARLAQGNVGWALRAIADPKLVAQQEEMIGRLAQVFDLGLDARLTLAESLTAGKRDRSAVRRVMEILALLGRDLLFLAQGLPAQLVGGEQGEMLERQARRLSVSQIHAYLQGLRLAMERIDSNVDPRLTLEALLVDVP